MRAEEMNQLHPSVRTESLYVPARLTAERMTVEQLRRGLCPKCRGDWHVCLQCPGGCSYGKQLAAVMTGQATAPETTPERIPARTDPVPPRSSFKARYSDQKMREIAMDACRRVALGESWTSVGKEYGYTSSYLVEIIKRLGLDVPVAKTTNEARHKEAIDRHVAMMMAVDAGMDEKTASKTVGRYQNISRAREYGRKYQKEIDRAYNAAKAKKQAVAQ